MILSRVVLARFVYFSTTLQGFFISQLRPLALTVVGMIYLRLSMYPAAFSESPSHILIHSLMLSSHITVPCRTVFAMPEDFEMWPYLLSFCLELHHSSHGLYMKCLEVPDSISSQGIRSFFQGHLCLWRKDSLNEKYNTKYYKIYFYLIFRACK